MLTDTKIYNRLNDELPNGYLEPRWYDIQNKTDILNISIHDEIGIFGVEAGQFMAELRAFPSATVINLSIHSPGGSVLDGLAIYNSLVAHGAKIYGHVEGIAASAASFVLMASDTISMPENGFIMIHNARGGAIGDSEDLRDMADIIDKLQNSVVNIYQKRTGMDRDELLAMMKTETWLTAHEAMENGFADTIVDSIDVAAKLGGYEKHFKELPINSSDFFQNIEKIATVNDLDKFLRDATGLSRKATNALVAKAKEILPSDSAGANAETDELYNALDKVKVPARLNSAS